MSDTLFRVLKVLGYLITSTLVAALLSPEFRDWISANPEFAAYAPLVNLVAVALAREIQKRLPEESALRKAL